MRMSSKRAKSAKKTLDRNIWDWYCETCLKNGKKVSKNSLQARAKWVFHEAGITDFKASDGWYRRFIQRWRDCEPNSEPLSKPASVEKVQTASDLKAIAIAANLTSTTANGLSDSTNSQADANGATENKQSPIAASICGQHSKDVDSTASDGGAEEFSGEIIDCLSKFIDTSELSQTSMDFFYDSEDSSFSTTQNALLLAETEHQSEGAKARHRKRGERYLPRFKEKVLSFVARHQSIKKAAVKFKIHGTTISHWRRELGKNETAVTGTVAKETLTAEQRLFTWMRRCRERGLTVTAATLASKACELAGEAGSPRWLVAWAGRLAETETSVQGVIVPASRLERNVRYPAAFKAEVAAFAEANSQAAASKLFAVSRRRVFDWLQAQRQLQRKGAVTAISEIVSSSVATSQAANQEGTVLGTKDQRTEPDASPRVEHSRPGTRSKDVQDRLDADAAVWAWFQAQTPPPSSKEVCAKGAELYAGRGLAVKCSRGWHRRWCRRHGVVLRFHADDRLLQWTLTRLEANKCVSHHDLQVHAMRLLSSRKPGFKASAGWALRFCRRHPLLLRSVPTLETPLPPHLVARVAQFRQTVHGLVSEAELPFSSVGNVDELYLSFGVDPDEPETCKPLLRRPSVADCHATVVLGCLADGTLLPPTVILKGSADANCTGVYFHPLAALDIAVMLRWLADVWAPAVGPHSILLADALPAHSAPVVREAARSLGADVRVMPGGCASKLQPLTVAVAQAVKTQVMKRWRSHNVAAQLSWQSEPKVKIPEPEQVLAWVNDACADVRRTEQETIRRSFLVTGITVAANGSEDHFIENASMIPVCANS